MVTNRADIPTAIKQFFSRLLKTCSPLTPMLILLLLCCLSCASGSDSDDSDSGDTGGDTGPGTEVGSSFSLSARTNGSGIAQANFQLAAGSNKFAVTAFTPSSSSQIRFLDLSSSSGANFLNPGGQEVSFADSFSNGVNAVNAPSRDVDDTPSSGDTFSVAVEAISAGGSPLSDAEVTFFVSSRADGSFSGGTLRINIFFVGEVGADSNVREVINRAIVEFRSIFSSQMGIGLDIRTFDIDGPLILPSPFSGSSLYASASNLTDGLGVNIFVSGDVNVGSGSSVLGISGGIIAPPVPSARSALAVGIIPGAGADGAYSDADIRLLGETLAHETGHYAGLFHPVDFSGETAVETDPLGDTDTCASFTACLANDSLTSNLMFTTPVSNGSGGTIPQNQLTSQQSGVVNRYVAVD